VAGLIITAVTLTATPERGVAPALGQTVASCSGGAGAVTKVVHTTTTLNKKYVSGLRAISAGDRLVTKKHAEVIFCLKPGVDCTLHQKAGVRIKPPQTALLMRLNRGRMTCGTTVELNPPVKQKILTAAGATLHISDPLFVVATNSVTTTVKVISGVVVVGSDGALTDVGPGQKVTVRAGEEPSAAQPLKPGDLTAAEKADVTRLTPKIPKPDYSRPAVGNSPTLSRIYARGSMVVGVDTTTQTAKDGFAFASGYFGFLGNHWQLTSSTSAFTPADAEGHFCGGTPDVYVTPQPEAVRVSPWRIPFFEDSQGQVWYLLGLGDDTFHRAIWRFLIQTLQAGDYGKLYSAQFGQMPPYAIFDPVLDDPGKTPTPFCIG
jgi:hypothetical protein